MGKLLDFFRKLGVGADTAREEVATPARGFDIDEEALEFFNGLTGELQVELSEPATPIPGLMNLEASPTARVISVKLELRAGDDHAEDTRPLTSDELDWVVFQRSTLELLGEAEIPVRHEAANGREFTIGDLVRAVEETERQTRGQTEWLGGVDVHHCFFEGISERADGSWEIIWGS